MDGGRQARTAAHAPAQMAKTEKTTAELQLEMNMTYEYSRITEEGSKMAPLSGPGLTGEQGGRAGAQESVRARACTHIRTSAHIHRGRADAHAHSHMYPRRSRAEHTHEHTQGTRK